jgi:hypothetical protein
VNKKEKENRLVSKVLAKEEIVQSEEDPYSAFLFGLRSPKTKEKCIGRLRMFFDFLGILPEGTMKERSRIFYEKAKNDNRWTFTKILQYLQMQKERHERKEISSGTVKNYYQAIKHFCEMSFIDIPWKKISKGLPKARKFADDRAPTVEEIRRVT